MASSPREAQQSPAVVFAVVYKAEAQAFGFGPQYGDVIYVESAHQQGGSGVHARYEAGHVGQQDIAVDVGDDVVKGAFVAQYGGVAVIDADLIYTVQADVLQRVAHTPVVDVDGGAGGGATHAAQYGEYSGAAAHVEQRASVEVALQQLAQHQAGGLVVAGSKGHLRVDDDVVLHLRGLFVEGAVDTAALADDDGLKEVLLPLLVPVALFGQLVAHAEGDVGHGEVGQNGSHCSFVVQRSLDVGFELLTFDYKALKPHFAEQCTQQVGGCFAERGGLQGIFNVLHKLKRS